MRKLANLFDRSVMIQVPIIAPDEDIFTVDLNVPQHMEHAAGLFNDDLILIMKFFRINKFHIKQLLFYHNITGRNRALSQIVEHFDIGFASPIF